MQHTKLNLFASLIPSKSDIKHSWRIIVDYSWLMYSNSSTINTASPWMNRIDFYREFIKSPGKHESWSIFKKVEHPTTFDWWEFRHDKSSYRLRKLSSVKIQLFHRSLWHHLKKIIKKRWLKFKNNVLIYRFIENVVDHELLLGNLWTFLHYTHRKQALTGGSSG